MPRLTLNQRNTKKPDMIEFGMHIFFENVMFLISFTWIDVPFIKSH